MRVRLKQRSPSVDTAEHPILLIPVSLYRVMDQHKLSREQWEERIQVWHAEHSGMLKWVVSVGPWAGQLAACLVTLSLYFYDMVLLVRGLGFELPVWAYSWCAFFSSVLNHMVKYSSIVCTGAENSVALWRSWACACLISDSFEWEKRVKVYVKPYSHWSICIDRWGKLRSYAFPTHCTLRQGWMLREVNVADFLPGNTRDWCMGIFCVSAHRCDIITSKVNPKWWMFSFNFCVWGEA